MKCILCFFVCVFVLSKSVSNADDSDFNTINRDGSFQFGLSNNDIGSHTHSATGTANNVVRGRYASRNPGTGNIDETVYTAGPRGFRARGPNIHRQMDLSQIPRGPIGTKDDPLADPFDDPSYKFQFRTNTYARRENADSTGNVRGLYSFVDDIGEKHVVRYAAGAGTGYDVYNAVPDSANNARYNAPLYKGNRNSRGRIAYERGPAGQYRFISSAPDQRRSESSGPDGVVRGSYSFLDDKGRQHTVEYIAGAGIGYRVVKTTIGPLSHILPAPVVPQFGLRGPVTNDLSDANIPQSYNEKDSFTTAESNGIRPYNRGSNSASDNRRRQGNRNSNNRRNQSQNQGQKPQNREQNRPVIKENDQNSFNEYDSTERDSYQTESAPTTRYPPRNRNQNEEANDFLENSDDNSDVNNNNNLFNDDDDEDGNLSTPVPSGPPGSDRNAKTDIYDRIGLDNKDGTLIKNVGDLYVGLPPGAVVRAHVQNIDLIPLSDRAPSPAEALKREFES